jgi:hypothetical protein
MSNQTAIECVAGWLDRMPELDRFRPGAFRRRRCPHRDLISQGWRVISGEDAEIVVEFNAE